MPDDIYNGKVVYESFLPSFIPDKDIKGIPTMKGTQQFLKKGVKYTIKDLDKILYPYHWRLSVIFENLSMTYETSPNSKICVKKKKQ